MISRSTTAASFLCFAILLVEAHLSTSFQVHPVNLPLIRSPAPHDQSRRPLRRRRRGRTIDLIIIRSQEDDNDNSPQQSQKELRVGPLGSLEVLAIVMSVFFVATVFFAGDVLFATPTETASSRILLDADEVLQSDFRRIETSVDF